MGPGIGGHERALKADGEAPLQGAGAQAWPGVLVLRWEGGSGGPGVGWGRGREDCLVGGGGGGARHPHAGMGTITAMLCVHLTCHAARCRSGGGGAGGAHACTHAPACRLAAAPTAAPGRARLRPTGACRPSLSSPAHTATAPAEHDNGAGQTVSDNAAKTCGRSREAVADATQPRGRTTAYLAQ